MGLKQRKDAAESFPTCRGFASCILRICKSILVTVIKCTLRIIASSFEVLMGVEDLLELGVWMPLSHVFRRLQTCDLELNCLH